MAPMEPEKKEKKIPRWEPTARDETSKEKFARKARENPFVPIGKFFIALSFLSICFYLNSLSLKLVTLHNRLYMCSCTFLIAFVVGFSCSYKYP